MKIISQIPFSEIDKYDERFQANVRIGGYDMDKVFPKEEAQCYSALIEESDIEKIYLLALTEFQTFTRNGSLRTTDIVRKAAELIE